MMEYEDAFAKESFTLKCMLFITINDYPALGNTSGQTIKGYDACVQCLENTTALWLPKCRKMVYMRHHRFLSKNHRYHKMTTRFDNTLVEGSAPPILTGK